MSKAITKPQGPAGAVGGPDPLAAWGTGAAATGEITPHDTNAQPTLPCRGLWVGVAGDIVIVDHRGYQAVLEGFSGWLPAYVHRVRATESGGARTTTADNIVAFQ